MFFNGDVSWTSWFIIGFHEGWLFYWVFPPWEGTSTRIETIKPMDPARAFQGGHCKDVVKIQSAHLITYTHMHMFTYHSAFK